MIQDTLVENTAVGDTMRVLVIEDDAEMANFIEKVLLEAGHSVDKAIDGERGLELARSADFDALVVDRMLPAKDGLTLLKEYREAGGTTPAVAPTTVSATKAQTVPGPKRRISASSSSAARTPPASELPLGSFSAMPKRSARRYISAQISSGAMPHSRQSTTRW